MGAQRAFHWAYGGDVTAAKIADFLILNSQSPRSLITCVAGVNNHLMRLGKLYGRQTTAQGKAQAMLAELETTSVEAIFDEGLHEFLSRFIGESAVLGHMVHECYLSGDVR